MSWRPGALRVAKQIFFGPKSADPHFQDLPDAKGTEWVALVFLVTILVLFGVFPMLMVKPIDTATVAILQHMGLGR